MTSGAHLLCVLQTQDSEETQRSMGNTCGGDFLVFFNAHPPVHPAASEFISRESPARRNVVFLLSLAVCVAVPAAWQAVGTAARTTLSASGEGTSEKCPLVRRGPFVAAVYVFHCCGHHGGLMNGGPVFGQTPAASALRAHSPRNSPHVWGSSAASTFSTASVTLSEVVARV